MEKPTLPMMPDFSGGPAVFLKEVRTELKKVTWPTREEVVKFTFVVIAVSVAIGLYIGALDIVITKVMDLFIKG